MVVPPILHDRDSRLFYVYTRSETEIEFETNKKERPVLLGSLQFSPSTKFGIARVERHCLLRTGPTCPHSMKSGSRGSRPRSRDRLRLQHR